MKTAFISGHLDLTQEEFDEHYKNRITSAFIIGHNFVVGDARGCDSMAQQLLATIALNNIVTVYHMYDAPRNFICTPVLPFDKVGGFTSDKERDEAMTEDSDYDIAWVREGRKNSGTAQNLKRRAKLAYQLSETPQRITKPLSEYHIKQLLTFRNGLRRDWSDYEIYTKHPDWFEGEHRPSKPNYTMEEFMTEMNSRPHIPNKKEGKAIRQEAAKRKV